MADGILLGIGMFMLIGVAISIHNIGKHPFMSVRESATQALINGGMFAAYIWAVSTKL